MTWEKQEDQALSIQGGGEGREGGVAECGRERRKIGCRPRAEW